MRFLLFILALSFTGAAFAGSNLLYVTYDRETGLKPQAYIQVDKDTWKQYSPGGREDFLTKIYFAEKRNKSSHGLKHSVCYNGNPDEIKLFLKSAEIRTFTDLKVKVSHDKLMLSITLAPTKKVRVTSCGSAGKGSVLELSGAPQMKLDRSRFIAQAEEDEDDDSENGFVINDIVKNRNDLPRFVLKADYENAISKIEPKLPWQGMNLKDKKQALQFALILQAYFYDGMVDKDLPVDRNFNAFENPAHYWCHMPWLNQGNNGREAIHGLTNERPLQPSANIYPGATAGSDWGIGYYNANGCKTIGKIFADKENPKFENVEFEDGTVSAKILFTTAKFAALNGAFEWNGHVSEPNSTERDVKMVRHLQMDISVKDKSLVGTKSKLGHWLMLTYYYDKKYKPDLNSLPPIMKKLWKDLPEGLQHMRPMGLQLGFEEPGDTLIFADAFTNQNKGRLNGPADNPKSSCMGCHGMAGVPNIPMAPGIITDKQFVNVRSQSLDFSQQLALAKRNFETN